MCVGYYPSVRSRWLDAVPLFRRSLGPKTRKNEATIEASWQYRIHFTEKGSSEQDSALLPVWAANNSEGFSLSCPYMKLAMV